MGTIASVSTPNAVGGIAVIRISGDDAIAVAETIFKPFGGKKVSEMEGYTCAYGIAHDNGQRIDDCVLTIFKAPHSYTGEDTIECHCHGSPAVLASGLEALHEAGALPAKRGEFTK